MKVKQWTNRSYLLSVVFYISGSMGLNLSHLGRRVNQNGLTYNPRGFGALCGIVGKAATVTSGDCVWLLVTEAHGVHRLASAADDPLQRETRRHRQGSTRASQHYITRVWDSTLKLTSTYRDYDRGSFQSWPKRWCSWIQIGVFFFIRYSQIVGNRPF